METIVKVTKTKIWLFQNINKIGKPLARLIKQKGEKNQQTQKNEKGERLQQTTQKYETS